MPTVNTNYFSRAFSWVDRQRPDSGYTMRPRAVEHLRQLAAEQAALIAATYDVSTGYHPVDLDSNEPIPYHASPMGGIGRGWRSYFRPTYDAVSSLDPLRLIKRPRKRLPVGLIVWYKFGNRRAYHNNDVRIARIASYLGGGKYTVSVATSNALQRGTDLFANTLSEPVTEARLFVQAVDYVLWQGISRLSPEQALQFAPPNAADDICQSGAHLQMDIQRARCTSHADNLTVYLPCVLSHWQTVKQVAGLLPATPRACTPHDYPALQRAMVTSTWFVGSNDSDAIPLNNGCANVLAGMCAQNFAARFSAYGTLVTHLNTHSANIVSDCAPRYADPIADAVMSRANYSSRLGAHRNTFAYGVRAIAHNIRTLRQRDMTQPVYLHASHGHIEFVAWQAARKSDAEVGKYVARYLRLLPKNETAFDAEMFDRAVVHNLYFYTLPRDSMADVVLSKIRDVRPYVDGVLNRCRAYGSTCVIATTAATRSLWRNIHNSTPVHALFADALLLMGEARTVPWRGEQALFERFALYELEDGSWTPLPPGPVIGGYHSSRNTLGKLVGSDPTGPYLGLELEVEVVQPNSHTPRPDREAVARSLLRIANSAPFSQSNRYCAAEGDGSLHYGFEIVTGYGSLSVHEPRLRAMFEDAKWPALRSHDTTTCGLHVHICKQDMTLLHAVKMTRFAHATANAGLVKDVARRYAAGGRFASACPDKKASPEVASAARDQRRYHGRQVLTRRDELQVMRCINSSRYELLNFHNEKTVEFRMFKGTTNFGTIMSALEFTLALYHFTKQASVRDLTADKFCEWVSLPCNRGNTVHLRALLARKGWTVFQPKRKALRSDDAAAAA